MRERQSVIGNLALAGLICAALTTVARAQTPKAPSALAAATAEIQGLIKASGAEAAVAWRPLRPRRKEEIFINATTRFHAASTMKVPVMIELYRQANARRLRLDDPLVVTNTFHSVVDGSVYELSATVDSDGEIYKAIGRPMTLRALCEAMITVSSNLAANNLIEKLGPKNIQSTVNKTGGSGMLVLRGVEDQKAFDAGKNNVTDARGLLGLFERIGRGDAVSRTASEEMVAMLARQTFNEGIPAGLPAGTKVAHKTGSITRIHHDAGIVFAKRPYVLVVLVRGIDDQKVSAKLMADISRTVYPLARD